ncbi:MAG: hypothetical protein M3Y64_01435, partial [Gemmatimonadota bacterium]|nr:hypothetical protein [Gemmatimonadota bacterium]
MTRLPRGGKPIAYSVIALAAFPIGLQAQAALRQNTATKPALVSRACQEDSVRVALPDEFNARPIRHVDIVTNGPHSLRVVGTAFDRMHARTRAGTVRRELLFAPGQRLDSLAVAESLRRLRELGFLDDVFLVARACNGPTDADSVDVTVVTRDAWSASVSGSTHMSGASIGLAERNVLGTGRTVRLGLQADHNGFNRSIGVRDPAFLGSGLIADVRLSQISRGASWQASVTTRRRALVDPWTLELRAGSYDRGATPLHQSATKRSSASVIVGRRLTDADAGNAVYLLTGGEADNSRLSSGPHDRVIGPSSINRRYVGALIGLAVQATHFDTLSWLLPAGGIVDVPHGVETQFVAGPGRDRTNDQIAGHFDAWIGLAHTLGYSNVVYSDLWASGYAGKANLRQLSLRASIVAARKASRGQWKLRLTAERMSSPDPDVRALASFDVTSRLLLPSFRLANDAVSVSAERSVHLREVIRGSMLDAALFTAGSLRHEPASIHAAMNASVVTVGAGLRLLPTRSPRSGVRLDVGLASIR